MGSNIALLIYQMSAIVCAIGAVTLAYDGAGPSTWGWFLAAAVITTIKVVDGGKDESKSP